MLMHNPEECIWCGDYLDDGTGYTKTENLNEYICNDCLARCSVQMALIKNLWIKVEKLRAESVTLRVRNMRNAIAESVIEATDKEILQECMDRGDDPVDIARRMSNVARVAIKSAKLEAANNRLIAENERLKCCGSCEFYVLHETDDSIDAFRCQHGGADNPMLFMEVCQEWGPRKPLFKQISNG